MQSSDIRETNGVEKQRHFIRAMFKSTDMQPVTQSERALLDAIFAALLRGEDVSDLTGIRPPHNRRPSDPIRIALHYLCLTKLMHESSVEAWRIVGDAWGMKKREVQRVIAGNWAPALAMLRKLDVPPETLLRLCERHARGVRPERRQSALKRPARRTGDPPEESRVPARDPRVE
jgi:hypothetical protein